jgi:hypothetical protein
MMRKLALACLLAALLLVALANPSAAASRAPQAPDFGRLWNGAWPWLLSLPSPVDRGCDIDPNGRCRSSVPQTQSGSDAGCSLDPDGRLSCRASAGCDIDPDGRLSCRGSGLPLRNLPPGPKTDAGCEIDPDGRCR